MLFLLYWSVVRGKEFFAGAVVRYGLLERLKRGAAERGVDVIAFGLGREEVRIVLRGEPEAVANVARGVKVGTIRAVEAFRVPLRFGETRREEVDDVEEAVRWCHRLPIDDGAPGPLASPWSSHRDLLGWRDAPFFDAEPLRALVDAKELHVRLGGDWPPSKRHRGVQREPLTMLMRLAAAIRGVLPTDRRCFGLFCQLAKARGWAPKELAHALMVTTRRIRQLCEVPEPLVRVAVRALGDPRLCFVP